MKSQKTNQEIESDIKGIEDRKYCPLPQNNNDLLFFLMKLMRKLKREVVISIMISIS